MQFAAVHEVEHLHHHKCIEDECEMSGIYVELLENRVVIFLPVYEIHAAWSDCTTWGILELWLVFEIGLVVFAWVFRNEAIG